jgi:hypothetical protein
MVDLQEGKGTGTFTVLMQSRKWGCAVDGKV